MAGLASQQALAATTSDLLTRAATLDEAGLSQVASDLGSFATVLASQPHLRRLLTESTGVAEAKAALVTRLLGGKASDAALALATAAVTHRWSTARDLTDAFRRLSRTAVFLQAERTGQLDDVEEQLFRFGRILDANPELAGVLDDPSTTADGRVTVVERLLAHKAHPTTVQLLTELARDTAGRAFSHGVADLVTQAAERRDKLVATVTAATELSADEIERLRGSLARVYSRQVAVHVVVDPAIGGGLRVRVGDEVIDGSIEGRLKSLRQRLARR